jgi:hypothetical protein
MAKTVREARDYFYNLAGGDARETLKNPVADAGIG